jgi:hypothetical protein
MIEPWFSAGLVALAAVVGGLLPWTRRWSSEGMHRLVALSAGIFLGTVLHMAGDLALHGGGGDGHDHGHGHAVEPGAGTIHDHAPHPLDAAGDPGDLRGPLFGEEVPAPASGVGPWFGVLVGFLGLAALERLVLRRSLPHVHGHDAKHALLWRASLAGLAIHSVFEGFALAGLRESAAWEGALLFTLLHKLVETFSLSTILRLAGLRVGAAVGWLLAFALVAPVAFVAGSSLLAVVEPWQPYAVAVAVGTFLYVTVLDLLPEAFHRGSFRDRLPYLVFGLALGGFVPGLAHGHGNAIWSAAQDVFLEMAPYLLFGFVVAGFVSQVLDPRLLRRHLAGESPRAIAMATVVGAPLPLCSCSVVPVAASLRDAGAGRGPTSAFLVATPETGVDSVATTYALLGPVMAVVRPIAALVSAFATGVAVAWFGGDAPLAEPAARPRSQELGGATTAHARGHDHAGDPAHGCGHDHGHDHGHGHDHEHTPRHTHGAAAGPLAPAPAPPRVGELAFAVGAEPSAAGAACCAPTEPGAAARSTAAPRRSLVERALRYGFVDLVDDLAWPLVIGVALSGLLAALLEPDWLAHEALRGPLGYLAMLAIGLPVYVCAAASTPIAAVLLAKGLNPGAVLVFLLASPATNFGSLVVVKHLLGARGLVVHVLALAAVTLVLGVATDLFLAATGLDVVSRVADVAAAHEHGLFSQACAAVLLVVLVASSLRKLGAPRAVASGEPV